MIQISTSAAKRITELKTEDPHAKDKMLRVSVTRGGCSGYSYKMDFDLQKNETDRIFEDHGVQVVIDSKSLLYIAGMTLDFEGGLNGKGFVFSNPNANKTCGCGTSFAI
ncbi:MAG: iron-sulfur cluster assembly accessory protein [Bdellovibrionales bacterium]|nr:iron-sulfur cluster assembly accessory protein [Bdellovibrionales bacterium]